MSRLTHPSSEMVEGARRVHFEVTGLPQPQGNKTGFHVNGKTVLVEGRRGKSRQSVQLWRAAVTREAAEVAAEHGMLDGALHVNVLFRMPRVSTTRKRDVWHISRPDADKLCRAVFDAMTQGGLIKDDSRICELYVGKRFCVDDEAPGCGVTIIVGQASGVPLE